MSSKDPQEKVDAATLLANLKDKTNPESSTPPVVPVVPDAPAKTNEDKYQQYNSSRVSACLITPTGKRINFTNYQYYTKDPEIVAYLDSQIQQGLSGFVKGNLLTAAELDPETAKRRKIIEEFKASQEGREFGDTKPKSERVITITSDEVAN